MKKAEKKLIIDSYRIALAKQDMALELIDIILQEAEKEAPRKLSKTEVAELVFLHAKGIPNKDIEGYLKAPETTKRGIRLAIQKVIFRKTI